MTFIVLKNPVTGYENGKEIDVDIISREFEGENEIIKTNDERLFIRKWEEYSPADPFGWKEAFES